MGSLTAKSISKKMTIGDIESDVVLVRGDAPIKPRHGRHPQCLSASLKLGQACDVSVVTWHFPTFMDCPQASAKMRTLRSTALLLLCLLATVHGIRLEREVSASLKQQIHEEKKSLSGGTVVGAVVLCKGGHCSSGTVEERRSHRKVKEVHHKLPAGIYEDYCGPRGHNPKHH
ncbi:hypothetical protein QJS10_CPB19g00608 [Acorus calamus]|uniref:Uncharacterized protein n=1 Tax=Acorus calamus TaxID=4465 RepID=A0AAV9CFF3_ACOCL|nr:hypothetical protein QJS10_CPB19g00608 [Acorus calamus]